jgi:hypothetical protein
MMRGNTLVTLGNSQSYLKRHPPIAASDLAAATGQESRSDGQLVSLSVAFTEINPPKLEE